MFHGPDVSITEKGDAMRKKSSTTKLKLNQETLRALTGAEKDMAVGGADTTGPAYSCATSCSCTATCYSACYDKCYSNTGFCY